MFLFSVHSSFSNLSSKLVHIIQVYYIMFHIKNDVYTIMVRVTGSHKIFFVLLFKTLPFIFLSESRSVVEQIYYQFIFNKDSPPPSNLIKKAYKDGKRVQYIKYILIITDKYITGDLLQTIPLKYELKRTPFMLSCFNIYLVF